MQPLERLEEPFRVCHFKAYAVVPYAKDILAVLFPAPAELYPGPVFFRSKLPRVPYKVFKHHPQKPLIAPRSEPFLDDKIAFPFRVGLFQVTCDGHGDGAQVDLTGDYLGPHHEGKVHEVVYELAHPSGGGPYALKVLLAARVEPVPLFFEEQYAEPVYEPQGRAQVVRHRVGESLDLRFGRGEVLVSPFQLQRPLLDPALQLPVELYN